MTSRLRLVFVVPIVLVALIPAAAQPAAEATPSARVGAFYFDGWAGPLSHFHFDGLTHPASNGAYFPERRPLSGWRDHTPEALTAQLRWARAAGISFLVFDWYYDNERFPGNGPVNSAHDLYLKLRDHEGVGYALQYVANEPFQIPLDQWPAVVEQWVTEDFTNPDYVRINGKPLLVIHETQLVEELWGGAQGVNRAIAILQDSAKRHGLPSVFVVGAHQDFFDRVSCFLDCDYDGELLAENYDALAKYGFNQSVEPVDGPIPYSSVVAAEEQTWERYAQQSRLRYIPSVVAGWDGRAANEAPLDRLYWFERSPGQLGGFVRDAVKWVEGNPGMRLEPAPAPPVVLIEAWNELQEGSYIVPTDGGGYSDLREVATAVGMPWAPPPKRRLTVPSSTRGTVMSKPAGIACPPRCSATFDEGVEVTLSAKAKRGSTFDSWVGRCTEDKSEPACPVVLVRDSTVKALLTATAQRRSLMLRLNGARATGTLRTLDGYRGCATNEPVQLQRKSGAHWTTVASVWTDDRGRYSTKLPARPGTYRAAVPRRSLGDHTCLAATSATKEGRG